MKRFYLLGLVILLLSLITGCGSPSTVYTVCTATVTETVSQIATQPATAQQRYMMLEVIPENSGTLKIGADPGTGFTFVSLTAQGQTQNHTDVAFYVPCSLAAAVEPAPGYVFSHWEGELSGTASTAVFNMQDNGEITAVFEAVPTTTATNPAQGIQVIADTHLNEETIASHSLILTENTLNISSAIHYTGVESVLLGVPVIRIMNSTGDVIKGWYLFEDQTQPGLGNGIQDAFNLVNNTTYHLEATWDLTDLSGNIVPVGPYTLIASILTLDPDELLTTNEGEYTIFVMNTEQTSTPTPEPDVFDVQADTSLSGPTFNATSSTLTTGEGANLHIHSQLEYVGTEEYIIGIPYIVINDEAGEAVASWYLNEAGSISSDSSFLDYYDIDKDTPYTMDVTWDLIDMGSNLEVPNGQYTIQVTIFDDATTSLLSTNEGDFTIFVVSPEQTSTPEPDTFEVQADTTLNGETIDDLPSDHSITLGQEGATLLHIQSQVTYTGEAASFYGAPVIIIRDAANDNLIGTWYLDQNGNVLWDMEFAEEFYPVVKDTVYDVDFTWNLCYPDTGTPLESGEYTLQVTIYSQEFLTLYTTNEGLFSLIIGHP